MIAHASTYPAANAATDVRSPRIDVAYRDASGVTAGNIIAAIIRVHSATKATAPRPMVPASAPMSIATAHTTVATHAAIETPTNVAVSGDIRNDGRTATFTVYECSAAGGAVVRVQSGGLRCTVLMLRAALRDLQWRWKRFVIAMLGVALVFAMGLIMTGLDASFTNEVSRTLRSIGAERWAVASDAAGPFSTFSPITANVADEVGGSPAMILRETVQDGGQVRDLIVMGVVPGKLGAPDVSHGSSLDGPNQIVVDRRLPGKGVGDTVSFGGKRFTVVGTVSGQSLFAGIPLVYISLSDAQAIATLRQPLATAILFPSVPGALPPDLRLMTNADVKSDVLRPLKAARSVGQLRPAAAVVGRGDRGGIRAVPPSDGTFARLRRLQGHGHLYCRDRTRPRLASGDVVAVGSSGGRGAGDGVGAAVPTGRRRSDEWLRLAAGCHGRGRSAVLLHRPASNGAGRPGDGVRRVT